MSATRRPRKAYRPRAFVSNPLAVFRPAPEAAREALMLKFYSALESMVRGSHPDSEDWRLLADAINVLETLALHTRRLPAADVMPMVNAAITGMVGAAKRFRAGQGMRLDAPGIEAIRQCLGVYAAAMALLTEREMSAARDETQRRLNLIYRSREALDNVVMV